MDHVSPLGGPGQAGRQPPALPCVAVAAPPLRAPPAGERAIERAWTVPSEPAVPVTTTVSPGWMSVERDVRTAGVNHWYLRGG
jgi:hypothetical protein